MQKFGLWLMPKDQKVQQQLDKLIETLAEKHQREIFPAHISLGSVEGEGESINKLVELFCQQQASFSVELGEVAVSTTHWQCVFARIVTQRPLMSCYSQAQKHFSFDQSKVYMPHLSLLYADLPLLDRVAVAESIQLPLQKFTIGSVKVLSDGSRPREWETIGEYQLQ